MDRHPEYKYTIGEISKKERWIFIIDDSEEGWYRDMMGFWEFNGPAEFLHRIKDKTGWTIQPTEVGYRFAEDPLQLEYWFDDLFGFTVGYRNLRELDGAIEFLKQFTQ